MFGFKKRVRKAGNELKKIENRDLMQATVAASLLVAAADGAIESSETAKMNTILAAHPSLQGFGAELQKTVLDYTAILVASFRNGKLQMLKEIGDCAGVTEDAEVVLVTAIDVAEAGGKPFGEEEQAVLETIAAKLGLSLDQYV